MNNFSQFRHSQGFTQESLARALFVDRSTVARWERGMSKPQPSTRKKIAEIMGVDISLLNNIFGYDNNGSGFSDTYTGEIFIDDESDTSSTLAPVAKVRNKNSLVLIGGYPGSGKTEFGRMLSRLTHWPQLDKDTLTRPLVESLLVSYQENPNMREGEVYDNYVRPLEYSCLMDSSFTILDSGLSVILTAPFLREFDNRFWITNIEERCEKTQTNLIIVWIHCQDETRYKYLAARKAARDVWKLNNWTTYLKQIQPQFIPDFPHYNVENNLEETSYLSLQAQKLLEQLDADYNTQ